MSDSAKKFMNISVWITIFLFVIRCLIDSSGIASAINQREYLNCSYSIYGYAGEAIGVTAIFMAVFNKWLWKKKPFYFLTGELPVLAKHYKGTITFVWDGVKQTRNSEIWIDQTFLNVSVKLGTNEWPGSVSTAAKSSAIPCSPLIPTAAARAARWIFSSAVPMKRRTTSPALMCT